MLTKTKIKGIAVGSAVAIGASSGAVEGRASMAPVGRMVAISPPDTVRLDSSSRDTTDIQISISLPSISGAWTEQDARRFRVLTAKRAQLIASSEEQQEFAQLQQRRRVNVAFQSGVDALTEWRRQRFAHELLELLSKNVTFLSPADQERFRPSGQTTRS